MMGHVTGMLHGKKYSLLNKGPGMSDWAGHVLFFFFFFGGTGVWTRVSRLLGRCSYCFSHSTRKGGDRVLRTICPGLALNCDPPDFCLLSS
jgi:hypothetical protein